MKTYHNEHIGLLKWLKTLLFLVQLIANMASARVVIIISVAHKD